MQPKMFFQDIIHDVFLLLIFDCTDWFAGLINSQVLLVTTVFALISNGAQLRTHSESVIKMTIWDFWRKLLKCGRSKNSILYCLKAYIHFIMNHF